MSGEMAARALYHEFDAIRRAELTRLRRKLASLTAAERMAVEIVTARVVEAIARTPARTLAREESPVLVRAVVDLFRVS